MPRNFSYNLYKHLALLLILTSVVVVNCDDIEEEGSHFSARSSFVSSPNQHMTIQEQIKWEIMKKIVNEQHVSIISDGDIILGGLFPVHEKGDDAPCGPKVYNRGVQRLEAMMYAVDRINNDPHILPGIKIGVHILDTCSTDTYALNQSLQFIQTSIKSNMDLTSFKCKDNSIPRLRENRKIGPVMGVVGGSYSSVSMQVANLLRLFHIPQISPASTAKALSDKTRFDLFARTVPPDMFQSIALVDIVAALKWTYVSTIYSEGSYGENGIETFHKEVNERNVCIAISEKIPTISNEATFDKIISKLLKKPYARGVILFTRAEDARGILKAAHRANITDPFTWIASDAWGKQTKLVEGMDDVAEGALTVELQSKNIAEFDKYMQSLTPEINKRNPWFNEYWEDFFSCTMEKNIKKYLQNEENTNVCLPDSRLSETNGYEQEPKIQFVIDAVYAFAYALNNLHKDICRKGHQSYAAPGLCPAMANFDGASLYKDYILNLAFEDIAGSEVKFDEKGDGLARYDIYNYQKIPNTTGYHYKLVGKWHKSLELNLNQIKWNKQQKNLPRSVCSLPCEVGMFKRQQEDTCCWTCDKCQSYEYLANEYTCIDCGPGKWPIDDKTDCYELPEEYIDVDTIYGYVALTFAAFGTLCTIAVMILYIKYYETPVVRASGREFHLLLLPNLLLCYGNTILLYMKPAMIICIIQRFSIAIGFSVIYSVLLVKTNRLSRIFLPSERTAARPRFIMPKSQLLITLGIVSIQVIIVLVCMIIEPPGTEYVYPRHDSKVLKCNANEISFLSTQIFNVILIICCTYYAIKTRQIPENFNESKYIGFTMYTTCIIWLAFLPAYFTTGNTYETQVTTLSVSITLSAFVTLVCIYAPKIEILLFHPEQNIRTTFTNTGTRGGGGGCVQTDLNNEIQLNNMPQRSSLPIPLNFKQLPKPPAQFPQYD